MEISVIIPTYNRALTLAKTLAYLPGLKGTEGLAWEILVVDNNSKDYTRNVVESFASRSGLNVRRLFEEEQGSSHARNRGIREAAGQILLFIEDDVVIPSHWMLEMRKAFEDYQAACVGGRVLLDKAIKLPAWWPVQMRAPLSFHDIGDEIIVSNRGHRIRRGLALGGNLGFQREALERNGVFRTDLGRFGNQHGGGEDNELVQRFQQNGETVVYSPRAILYHSPDLNRYPKSSLPAYFYHVGITRCQLEMISSEKTRRIAGVPLWRYRLLLVNTLRALAGMLTLNRKTFFYQRMSLYEVCGYVAGMMQIKRGTLLAVKPGDVSNGRRCVSL